MLPPEPEHRLQVLIATERDDRLETITAIVEALGHEVVGRHVGIRDVGLLSRSTGAEIALVGLGLDGEHALEQISAIVHDAACPVIAVLDAKDPSYLHRAAQRGVFATGQKLVDVAEAVGQTHRLLPTQPADKRQSG